MHSDFPSLYAKRLSRRKRDATGALEIRTNHADPIHADVKYDPPHDKVTPPKDILQGTSYRKSLPHTTRLDIVRALSRLVALLALLFTAVVEFYPLVYNLYYMIYDFMYPTY
ncbi:uncharacterized protein LOC128198957 [Bicyclus anynana]|uniref:Uncharacterized protein LOC128198957 n=1 Tax=Bicyclus anynana TaxID=110368 RepID=A0ABM3LV23_BICAN|nr:uncharacterized protein LOC128198957 [Bicyclus anynana]